VETSKQWRLCNHWIQDWELNWWWNYMEYCYSKYWQRIIH